MYEVDKESTLIDGYKLKSKGVFNLEELYTELAKWFKHYGYDWKELEYKKTDNPDGSKIIEIRWECPKGIDNYVSMQTNIFLKANVSDVEVTIGNEKKRMNKGTIEMKFKTKMIKNTEVFKNKTIGLIYDKLLIKDRLDAYEDEIFSEATKLIDEVKEYLNIYAR